MLVALQPPTPAWAWGRLGHRVTSRIAEKQLSPKAKEAIKALLEEGETLADASTWADEHRRALPKTAPWLYLDVPLDGPKYDSKWSADDPKKGCVVDKINEFRAVLKDASRSRDEKRFALRFLIHCIEDLHMPMHVGESHDRGGNDTQVRFFDRGTNMHRLWDTDMIARVGDTEDFWLKDLAAPDTLEARAAAMKGTVEDWATESLLAARQAYQVPETGNRLKPGQKLADAYLEANVPVVRRWLYSIRDNPEPADQPSRGMAALLVATGAFCTTTGVAYVNTEQAHKSYTPDNDKSLCIQRHLPEGAKDFRRGIFAFVYSLRLHHFSGGDDLESLGPWVERWHLVAQPIIRMSPEKVWREVELCWGHMDDPGERRDEWARVVAVLGTGGTGRQRAERVFRAGAAIHKGKGSFPLGLRLLADLADLSIGGARKAARRLQRDGVITEVERGKRGRFSKQATLWKLPHPKGE